MVRSDNTASATGGGTPARPAERETDQGTQPPIGSKADYRSLVAQLIDPVVIVSRGGRIRFMNPAAHQRLKNGLTARLETYLSTERGKRSVSNVNFPLDDGKTTTLAIVRRDIEWAGKPAALLALHDISRYTRATQRVRNSHLRKLSLLRQVPLATYVVALGDESVPPFLSPQFEDLLGHPRESWKGNAELWRQFIHDEDYERVVQDLSQAIKNEAPLAAEYRMTARSGDLVWVREEACFIKDEVTNQSFLRGVLIDITEKTLTKQQLSSARRKLEEIEERHSQELEKTHKQVQQELTEAKRTVEELRAGRAPLEDKLNERAAEVVRISAELQDRTGQCERAEKENKALRQELDTANRATEKLKATADDLETQLSERSGENLRTYERLHQEVSQRERLEKENKALSLQIAAASRAAEQLETELSERTAEVHEAIERASERSAELVTINAKLQDQTSRRERAEEENKKLGAELSATKRTEQKLAACRDRLEQWAKTRVAELENAVQQLHEAIGSTGGGKGASTTGA